MCIQNHKISSFGFCNSYLHKALCKILMILTVCYYHVSYEFQSESTFYTLPKCQRTPSSKPAPYLKFNWQWRDSNPQPLSSYINTQPFIQTGHAMVCLRTKGLWIRNYVAVTYDSVLILLHPNLYVNSKDSVHLVHYNLLNMGILSQYICPTKT